MLTLEFVNIPQAKLKTTPYIFYTFAAKTIRQLEASRYRDLTPYFLDDLLHMYTP